MSSHCPVNNENKLNNEDGSFSKLIEKYDFFIPSYQRAYSWTEKQVSLFIADLAEHAQSKTQYYLGHYILESKKNLERVDGRIPVDIVDGQQRLTTVAIFIALCRCLSNSNTLGPSLRLSVVEYDKERFNEILLPETMKLLANQEEFQEATASQERVVLAIQTFYKSFFKKQNKSPLLSMERIDAYLHVINKAAVSVGVYESKAVAAQIFELHNTRGVLLTETEKVKALLMKYVYLNNMEEDVTVIQESFAEVFKLEERAAVVSFRGEMSLDDILAHHLRAVDDGINQGSYTQPQSVEGENGCVAYVKKKLASFTDKNEGVIYAIKLAGEFAKTMNLVCNVFVEQDVNEPLIGDVILLDQRRSMTFLLLYFRAFDAGTQSPDHKLLLRWESFLSLWNFHDVFYNMKSGNKDSFPKIFNQIQTSHTDVSEMLQKYYSGNKNFAYRKFQRESVDEDGSSITGLSGIFHDHINRHENHLLHRAYTWGHWHGRYKYWLYKYEIEMTEGREQIDQVRSSLRKLFKENDVTLDHIIPHELEWTELSEKGAQTNELKDWDPDDKKQAEDIWKEIGKSIEGIGNLVILSRSANASIQNMAPYKRALEYRRFELESVSYNEISTWKARAEWSDMTNDHWKFKIEERGERILTKIKEYFTDEATWPSGIYDVPSSLE